MLSSSTFGSAISGYLPCDMGKVLWHTMMSLDGFIAGPNDEMEWMSGVDGGEGRTIDEVLGSTGSVAGWQTNARR
jgi:hypothetical protein